MKRGALCWMLSAVFASPAVPSPDVPGGELVGQWRQDGLDFAPVTFSIRRERAGEGRISTRLGAEGERFVGEYLRLTGKNAVAEVRRFYIGWTSNAFDDLRTGPTGLSWVRDEYSFELFRERNRGAVVATLIGDRGGRMRCRFELIDDAAGLPGGANGSCQLGDGDRIRFGSTR